MTDPNPSGSTGGSRRRRVLVAVGALVGLLGLFFGGGGWYFAEQIRADALAIERGPDPTPTPGNPGELEGREGPIAYSEVTYPCGDGRCPAWLVPREEAGPGDGDTWAVLVHGRGATRAEPLRGLHGAVRAGLPSLVITYRNDTGVPEDPSGYYRYGQTEWADLLGAVEHAREQGARDVVLFGYSMGGAIVASFLEREVSPIPVRGVVLDSPMLDFGATVDFGASRRSLPLIGAPIPGALVGTAKAIAGARFDIDWDALDYVDGDWLTVPALVFHGDADTTVPLSTSVAFADRNRDLVRLVTTAGAAHVGTWEADPAGHDAALDEYLASLR